MTEKKIEQFQDLLLRGPRAARPGLRQALISQAQPPWRHVPDREADLRQVANDADVIAFERDEADGVDAVGLVLWERDEGYEVVNIVPQRTGELGEARYNRALEDFLMKIARPAADRAKFEVETTAPHQGLEDWISGEAAEALRRFSAGANKSTGSSHPMDRRRWYEFLLAAHPNPGKLDGSRLMQWLVQAENWPEDEAHDLVVQYEFGLGLLDAADQRDA